MEEVVTTILFDGQFWIALIEKYGEGGMLYVGKHTFGNEPTRNDIIDFYLDIYHRIRLHPAEAGYREIRRRSRKEIIRNTKNSHDLYKEQQRCYLLEQKRTRIQQSHEEEQERYRKRTEKRKQKRRGH